MHIRLSEVEKFEAEIKIQQSEAGVTSTTFILSGPGQQWGGRAEEDRYSELDPGTPLQNCTILLLNQVHTVKITGDMNWNN